MSCIISYTATGYRKICDWCDGTNFDRDDAGGCAPCPHCENGVIEVEYEEEPEILDGPHRILSSGDQEPK